MARYTPARLREQQRLAFKFFVKHCNPENGLVADNTRDDSPCSIAAVGFALSCYPIAVENHRFNRSEALKRTLSALRFLKQRQNDAGHNGFFYHFLDMKTGERVWKSELSTIDTTLLFYGALSAAEYFDSDTSDEREVREVTGELIERADWRWACDGQDRVALAWKPERGFLRAHWSGYNEALLLQILALASPRHSIPPSSYAAWCSTYQWKSIYGCDYLYAGPLFIHQFPHLWLDLKSRPDEFMRRHGSDYFENSRRATMVQQEYCRRNPGGFEGYNELCWGLTASDGPVDASCFAKGKPKQCWGYRARGVPFGPDDGTLAPWGVVASLPFAPNHALSAMDFIEDEYPRIADEYGFRCGFNPSCQTPDGCWVAPEYFAIDQGPVVMAIENHLTGLPWQLLRNNKILNTGLERAGFERSS